MIRQFSRQGDCVAETALAATEAVHPGCLWLDIFNPTPEEEKSIESQLGIEIPTHQEVWKNETLNRLYQDNGVSYMTAAIISKADSPYPTTSAITLIMSPQYLVTIRYIAPTSFQNFAARLVKYPKKFTSGMTVLEGLLEEIILRVAYNSEGIVSDLDKLSHDIFGENSLGAKPRNPSSVMKDILKRLGTAADLNSKINESLHSMSRMLAFFNELAEEDHFICTKLRTLTTDVEALTRQTGFMSDKITFQLDATMGMINIEQNVIIKIFSVVAVFFMPPTLISSIYGMNFTEMPELHWALGYPWALGLMVLVALIPYFYFRRKGWL